MDMIATLRALCPDVGEDVLRDFVSRMDAEYFERFQPADIARHITLAGQLDPDHPAQVSIVERTGGQFEVAIVAYDYFSEFAALCGLLSSFGLDIREGSIYTFADSQTQPPRHGPNGLRRRAALRPGLSRKKIVDVFLVHPLPGMPFGATEQRRFAGEIDRLVRLLDAKRFREARRFVNRRLVETLGRSRSSFTGLLAPVDIRFDNRLSPSSTVMDIRSTDTPAFLYAFANALTMRGLYIHKARFEHVGTEVRDRFEVRSRHGRKIEDQAEQQELTLTATLIKQFTQHLTWAPDPGKALDAFDQFLDRMFAEAGGRRALKFLAAGKTLTLLARLLGTSDFLWEDFLRRQHDNLLPLLENYQKTPLVRPRAVLVRELRRHVARARTDDGRRRALNQYKDRELFRIDMKHLLEPASTLPDFSRALTNLAEAVVEEAARDSQALLSRAHGIPKLAPAAPCPFAVFGMGKFGGRELGYASDIEVLFVYGGPGRTSGRHPLDHSEYYERLVQDILQRIEAKQEGIFHLDVRLRPHGGKGLLANTLDELLRYYNPSGLAAPFERQALIKLRFVAGDATLGRRVEAHRDSYVYSTVPWDLSTALDLRQRQLKELVERGTINVKYSPGGIVDIEYAVQYLQLTHGHAHPALRRPNTLEALTALEARGLLDRRDAAMLREAYLFLRGLIDALRIVRGHAKDLVLPDAQADEFIFLARRLGYTTEEWRAGAARLTADIAIHMERARMFFTERFERRA
jgi:glutamate-ammonia-ligase adenylyltransferase